MLNRLLTVLYRRWGIRTLSAKLLLPSLALILLSLVGTSAAFLGGTRLTHTRLLGEQAREASDLVVKTLNQREEAVSNAGSLLASDPGLVDAVQRETGVALTSLSSRTVVARDRFDLALVQVYDQHGVPRANLMLSNVASSDAEASSLLDLAEPGTSVVRAVGDRLLLLRRFPMLEDAGTVVVGIDLETELERILAQDRLTGHVQLNVRGLQVGTCPQGDLSPDAFDVADGWVNGQYSQKRSVTLGSTPAELLLVRPTQDIERVTASGLIVTVGGVLLTGLLLGGLNVMVIRAVGHPVAALSNAAKSVAQGELDAWVRLPSHPLTIGEGDEVGLLVESFSAMADALRDLYTDLEARVEARTAELVTAAKVAQAVSSSFDLPAILRESAQIIKTHLGAVCPGVHHVGIYLVEEGHEVAVLRAAAGEGNGHMERANSRVPLGTKSPVAVAASERCPQVVQNVRVACVHLKPPLLLDTNSAAAAPLLTGDRLIGVLSVESKRRNAFSSNALRLLATLADQIAIGVHNARLYQQQLRVPEHCADLDRTRSHCLRTVSHRIPAPLNTLTRLAERLLRPIDGQLTDVQREDLRVIHESGQQLQVLFEDLLDVCRVQGSKELALAGDGTEAISN
jgi:GAF domain-containing protein/HAMP domain-containing protein